MGGGKDAAASTLAETSLSTTAEDVETPVPSKYAAPVPAAAKQPSKAPSTGNAAADEKAAKLAKLKSEIEMDEHQIPLEEL